MRHFLSICGPLTRDADTMTAILDLSRYLDWQQADTTFLLIEGVNQFCARLGRELLRGPDGVAPRVLPATIKQLTVDRASDGSADTLIYRATGRGQIFGTTVRVEAMLTPASFEASAPPRAAVLTTVVVAAVETGREAKTHAA
ncbi:hypothetical protein AAC691_17055 [Nguyenibacter vanlangensis]|uniref:Uncharacterized protein n=1 Tax=Nguyenibacter vanlangensis TaxID=1216886 RepID=A0ABZ3D396_9PROT